MGRRSFKVLCTIFTAFAITTSLAKALTKLTFDVTCDSDINLVFGEANTLTCDFSVTPKGSELATVADLNFTAFLSSGGSSALTDPTKTTDVTPITPTAAQGELALVDKQATDIPGVPVTLDFTDIPGCYDDDGYASPYIIMCVLVDKASTEGEPIVIPDTVCLDIATCKSIITVAADGGPTVATNTGNDLEVVYGTSKNFTLDITIGTGGDTTTATFDAVAEELFTVEVFLADATGSQDATTPVLAAVAADVVSVEPESGTDDALLVAVNASLSDLSGLNCENQTHVCVNVSPKDGSAWQWGAIGIDPHMACVEVICSSEIEATPDPTVVSNEFGDLDVVMGSVEAFNLDITLTTGHATAQISDNANALFAVDVYLANNDAGDNAGDRPEAVGTVTSSPVVIEPDVGVDEDPVVINVQADLDLDTLNCDDYHYVCVDLKSDDETVWTWSADATTHKTACVQLTSCIGKIFASLTLSAGTSESLVVTMGPQRLFTLDVEVDITADTASAEVDANGDDMFDIKVYLASDEQGTEPSEFVDATNITTAPVTLSEAVDTATVDGIQAVLDLDGLACVNFTHVCAYVTPKDYPSSEPWMWAADSDTACVAINTSTPCSIQVTEESVTVAASAGTDLDIQMGSTSESFSLDVTLVTGDDTGELSLPADELFDVLLYLAADENGTAPSAKVSAEVLSDALTIDNRTTTELRTVTVDPYSLADLDCANFSHVCVDISPVDDQWAWTIGDSKTACVELGTCTSVISAGDIVANAADTTVKMGTTKLFNMDVTVTVVDPSAVVSGPEAALYDVEVFLAADVQGANSSEKYGAAIASTEAGATMSVANGNTAIAGISVQMNLEGTSCDDFSHVCVGIRPHDTATWEWADVGTTAKIACDEDVLDCTSQITANTVTLTSNVGGDLNIIMGNNTSFNLDVTIETGLETAKIVANADDTFAVKVYLSSNGGESGGTLSQKVDATVPSDEITVNPSDTIAITGVTLSDFDLVGVGCDDFSHVCVDVSPVTDATWAWRTGELMNSCVLFQSCSAVMTATNVDLSGTSGDINVAMGAQEDFTLDVTITTAATVTGKITGPANQLFDVEVYLASDDTGADSTPKVKGTLPSTTITIHDSDVQAISGVQVTLDLSSYVCASYSHVCVDVNTLSTDMWSWVDGSPLLSCVAFTTCTTAPTIATAVANTNGIGNLAVVMGETKTFHLDVTATLQTGDAISGVDLYSAVAYLATDALGSNPKPSRVAATITDNTVGFSDGSPAILTDVVATMDFTDAITCQQSAALHYTHVCVDLSENPAALPTWSATVASSMSACTALSPACQSQPLLDFVLSGLAITSPASKEIMVGENEAVTFDVDVQLAAQSGSANGDDNWKLEGYLSTEATGAVQTAKVPATSTSMQPHVGHDMGGGDSYTFDGVQVVLPLGQSQCGDLQFFCVELTQGAGADWYFDPFNPSTNTACVSITCTTDDASVQTISVFLGLVSALLALQFNLW